MHKQDVLGWVAIIGVPCLVIFALWMYFFFQPMMEAATYNRLTGKNVSTWDAMWVDLRVSDEVKK